MCSIIHIKKFKCITLMTNHDTSSFREKKMFSLKMDHLVMIIDCNSFVEPQKAYV